MNLLKVSIHSLYVEVIMQEDFAELSKKELLEAVKTNDAEKLKVLIDKGVDCNTKIEGQYPLLVAIENELDDVVELLLNHPKIDVRIQDDLGRSPLILACMQQEGFYVEMLLKHDNDFTHQGDVTGTALTVAAYHNNNEIIENLLEKIAIFKTDDHPEVINWLIRHSNITMLEKIIAKSGNEKETNFNQAARIPDISMASFKEEYQNFNGNFPLNPQRAVLSPLEIAIIEAINKINEVEKAKTPNQDVKNWQNFLGLKPLTINETALQNQVELSLKIIKLLLNNNAKLNSNIKQDLSKDAKYKPILDAINQVAYLSLTSNSKASIHNNVEMLRKDKEPKYELTGDLLESFEYLILNELESLSDMIDVSDKNLLLDVLFNPDLPIEKVASSAREIDPFFGYRFAIVYCCMYPHRWYDDKIKDFKQVVIDSYVKRTLSDVQNANEAIVKSLEKWIIQHAHQFIQQFFKERGISKPQLNTAEVEKESAILKDIRYLWPDLSDDVKKLIELQNNIASINNNEPESSIKGSLINNPSVFKELDKDYKLLKNSWKISLNDSKWQEIYAEIKFTSQKNQLRDESKMHKVIQAILYKEEKKCRWIDIPSGLLPYTTICPYYYKWKRAGTLDKINQIVAQSYTPNMVNKPKPLS